MPTSFGFVVPWRPRVIRHDRQLLQRTLTSIGVQLGPEDALMLSVQPGSPAQAPSYADGLELVLCRGEVVIDPAPPAVWSIARCRNLGLAALRPTDYVWCVDADIELPEGAVDAARELLAEHPGTAWAPMVADDGQERLRIGAGVAFLPRPLVEEAGAWSEDFIGYGSEDIDLFYRLGALREGFRVQPWRDGPVLRHTPHPPQDGKVLYGRANMELLRQRQRLLSLGLKQGAA